MFVSAVLAYKPWAEVQLAGLVWEKNTVGWLISQTRYKQLQAIQQANRCPWNGTVMPVDAEDVALFNAATVVTVRNGHKAVVKCSHDPIPIPDQLVKHSTLQTQ